MAKAQLARAPLGHLQFQLAGVLLGFVEQREVFARERELGGEGGGDLLVLDDKGIRGAQLVGEIEPAVGTSRRVDRQRQQRSQGRMTVRQPRRRGVAGPILEALRIAMAQRLGEQAARRLDRQCRMHRVRQPAGRQMEDLAILIHQTGRRVAGVQDVLGGSDEQFQQAFGIPLGRQIQTQFDEGRQAQSKDLRGGERLFQMRRQNLHLSTLVQQRLALLKHAMQLLLKFGEPRQIGGHVAKQARRSGHFLGWRGLRPTHSVATASRMALGEEGLAITSRTPHVAPVRAPPPGDRWRYRK